LRIGFANPSNSCVFILPICYSELRWKKKKASLLGEAFLRLGERRSPAILARLFAGISLVFRSPFARSSARLRCSRFPAPSSQLPEVFAMKWIDKSYFEFK
jgi:hypothetical protein